MRRSLSSDAPALHPYAQAVDACPLQLIKEHAHCSDEERASAAVRCCLDDGECGASICDEPGGLFPPRTAIDPAAATYEQAAFECHAHGMRLCEVHEVSACCGWGCGYDEALVWTHTECTRFVNPVDAGEEWLKVHVFGPMFKPLAPYASAGAAWIGATMLSLQTGVAASLLYIVKALSALAHAVLDPWFVGAMLVLGTVFLFFAPASLWKRMCARTDDASPVLFADDVLDEGQSLRAYSKLKEATGLPADETDAAPRGYWPQSVPSWPLARPAAGPLARPAAAKTGPSAWHMPIKPPLPEAVLRAGSLARTSASGVDGVRPGILANKRPDGTDTGLHAVISSTTSSTNATHCDVAIFDEEADARAAIARIGGDTRVAAPTPLKTLRNVDVVDVVGLTDSWVPPPWEPPTFRELKFKPLALGSLAEGLASVERIRFDTPKGDRDSFWASWMGLSRSRRARRESPWLTWPGSENSSRPPSPGDTADAIIGTHAATTRTARGRSWLPWAGKRTSPRIGHASSARV